MASNKVMINIKTDPSVKVRAQKIAKQFGIPLSALINAQLRQLIREESVAFQVSPRMSPWLEKIVGQVERDKKIGKNISRAFTDIEEMIAHLEK